ncbi:hypothetical protein Trco_001971 [Trichoderma cornu-damae]|uniref:Uncharacterized protein n=1 Tax=Trichoderma cornu-damae TaxID=654480 RepID=A0A9P8QRX4_9HYPO|nr:hypothetical protein Trco_001971 [Trichoderma cornu-damae]
MFRTNPPMPKIVVSTLPAGPFQTQDIHYITIRILTNFAIMKVISGHDVEVVERSPKLNPTGGGIAIRPNAGKVTQSWGLQQGIEQICDRSPSVTYRKLKTRHIRTTIINQPHQADWGTTRKAIVQLLYWSRTRRTVLSDLGSHEQREPVVDQTAFYSVGMRATQLAEDPSSMKLTENTNINIWKGDGGFVVTRYSPKFNSVGLLFAIQGETDRRAGVFDHRPNVPQIVSVWQAICKWNADYDAVGEADKYLLKNPIFSKL